MRRLRQALSQSRKIDLDFGSPSPIEYDNVLSEEWQAEYPSPEGVGNAPVSSGREKHDRDSDSLVSQEVDQTVSEPSFSRSASSNMVHGLKYRADSMVDSAQSASREVSPRSTAAATEESADSEDLLSGGNVPANQESFSAQALEEMPGVSHGEHVQPHSNAEAHSNELEQSIDFPNTDDSQAPLKSLIDEFKSCCDSYHVNERYVANSADEVSALLAGTNSRRQLFSLIQKVGELAEMSKIDLKAKAFLEPLDPSGSALLINLNNVAKALQMQEALPLGQERINAQQQSVIGSFVVLYNSIVYLEAEILKSYQILPQQGKEQPKNLKEPVIRFMKSGQFGEGYLTSFAKDIKSEMATIYLAQPTQKVKTLCNRVMAVLANIITVGLINFWKDSKGSCFTSALFKPARRDLESRHRVLESVTAIERSKTLSR